MGRDRAQSDGHSPCHWSWNVTRKFGSGALTQETALLHESHCGGRRKKTKQTRKGFNVETQIYISSCAEEAIQMVREQ